MSPSILFVDMNDLFLPLIRAVAEQGFHPILTGTMAQDAQKMGLHCSAFESFAPPDVQTRAQQNTIRIAESLTQALKLPQVQKAFSSPVGNFMPHTGEQFFRRLLELLPEEIAVSEAFEALLQQRQLALIVLRTEKVPFERTIIRHAARHGIPTLQIAHAMVAGLVAPVAGEYDRSLDSDYIAVFGKRAFDLLVKMGVEPKRIFITGSPYWDMFYSPEVQIDRQHACRQLKLEPEKPVVLFCTSYANASSAFYPSWVRQLAMIHRSVVQAVRQVNPSIQLIVRLHPSELGRAEMPPEEELALRTGLPEQTTLQAYKNWLAKEGISQVFISREHKIEAIRAADVVIVEGVSTIIPEVMMFQRPVIATPLSILKNRIYTTQDGIAMVDDLAQLPDLLGNLLSNPSQREEMVQRQNEALPEFNYGNDGRACERLTELIVRLATESQEAKRLPLKEKGREEGEGEKSPTLTQHNNDVLVQGDDTMEKTTSEGFYIHQAGKLSKGAVLDVGLKCTHSCKFCYYSYLDGTDDQFRGMRRARFRTLDECKEILRLLKQNGFINFDYTGGEPSLHPDIIEMTKYAHQELDLKGRMITLGQFLMRKMGNCKKQPTPSAYGKHDRLIDDLLEAGLTNFLFSIHAVDEELFNKITGESYEKLNKAMCYLDEKGFQYTSNTVAFEWNYKHLPKLAEELTKHGIYLHNFIIMNAYYEWNKEGRVFGVQAKYSDIYPYLKEAVDILESNNIGVNIRYAPLCCVKGMEKNLVGVVGVRYDPYEWMNGAGHLGGSPELCASVLPLKEGEIEAQLAYRSLNTQFDNGTKVTGTRGNAKFFSDKCVECRAKDVCDGIDPNYLMNYGSSEFSPYSANEYEKAPMQKARYKYKIPFIIKTEQYTDMKRMVAEEFKEFNTQSSKETEDARLRFSDETVFVSLLDTSIASEGVPGLTSIIILNLNGADHIRQCIESIKVSTKVPYDLIVVDNGSSDSSLEYLRSLSDIKLIENPENAGAPYARNQGLALAEGEYIAFLDNDTVVTEGWLECFIAYANAEPSVGVWGPRSNYASGPQFVQNARYSNYEELQAFSRGWAAANVKNASYVGRLILFCLFVKREVIQKIGGIDAAFGKWGWEDDDFGVRAQIAGYRLGIAHEIYIHHTGSQTAQTANIDYDALLQENWQVFRKKWNVDWKPGEPMNYPIEQLIAQPFEPARHAIPIPTRAEIEKLLYSRDEVQSDAVESMTLKKSEDDVKAEQFLMMADQYKELGEFERALTNYEKVLSIQPDCLRALKATGAILLELGRANEAIEPLKAAANLEPNSAEIHNELGKYFYQIGQVDSAEAEFQQAIQLDEQNAQAYSNLGVLYWETGNADAAIDNLKKAIEINSEDIDAVANLAIICYQAEMFQGAIPFFTQYLIGQPQDAQMHFYLSHCYFETGEILMAKKELETVLAIEPEHQLAQNLYAEIKE